PSSRWRSRSSTTSDPAYSGWVTVRLPVPLAGSGWRRGRARSAASVRVGRGFGQHRVVGGERLVLASVGLGPVGGAVEPALFSFVGPDPLHEERHEHGGGGDLAEGPGDPAGNALVGQRV